MTLMCNADICINPLKWNNMDYRVCFSLNGLTPFTWKTSTFELATEYANVLCNFDLGRIKEQDTSSAHQRMLAAYKAYRREHGVNHPSMIITSTCTIDRLVDGTWYIVSEDLETEEEDPYMESYS